MQLFGVSKFIAGPGELDSLGSETFDAHSPSSPNLQEIPARQVAEKQLSQPTSQRYTAASSTAVTEVPSSSTRRPKKLLHVLDVLRNPCNL